MKINALGFIEVFGLVPAIEAADAMIKSANVRLIKQHSMAPGMVTVVVEGDVAACRAAVDAGVAAAERLGPVISRLEIPRPTSDTESFILDYLNEIDQITPHRKRSSDIALSVEKEVEKEANLAGDEEEIVEEESALDRQTPIQQKATQSELDAPKKALTKNGLISVIKSHKKGVTFRELIEQFATDADNLEALLKDLLNGQKIIFKQMRYRVKK